MKKRYIIIAIILVALAVVGISTCVLISRKSTTASNAIKKMNNIEGKYSNVIIADFETAKQSLEDVKEELNINSIEEELVEANIDETGEFFNTYELKQKYEGLEVCYSGMIIYTDKEGNASGIINKYQSIPSDFNITPKNDTKSLEDIAIQKADLGEASKKIENSLVIYPVSQEELTLAHKYVITTNFVTYTVIISDETKEVIEFNNPIKTLAQEDMLQYENLSGSGEEYELRDNERNLTVVYYIDENTDPAIYGWETLEEANNMNVDLGITTLGTVQKAYDYFKVKFDMNSIKGDEELELGICTGVKIVNGKNYSNNAYFSSPSAIAFGADNKYNDDIETVTHEYTHGIFYYEVGDISETNYQGKAINEAYADIMGMCAEAYYNNTDEIDGYMNGVKRKIEKSKNKFDADKENGGLKKEEHADSTIISRAAYNMSACMTIEQFEKLWFNSMKLLPQDCSFYDCEYAVLKTAEKMNLSDEQIKKIKIAFDNVGLVTYDEITKNVKDYTDKKWEEEIADKKPEENNGIKLNSELQQVYAFANKLDGSGNTKIVALKEDGTEVEIINTGTTTYDCLDYSYGKLYLQEGTEFYSIDLTKGDKNYNIESIYKVTSDVEWEDKRMQVHNGVLYFNKGRQQLVSYNLNTKKEEIIVSTALKGNSIDFRVDKENDILYYCKTMAHEGIGSFGIYDISTKETKDIVQEDRAKGKGDELLIGTLTDDGIIVYRFNNYTTTIGFEYNRITGGFVKIDEDMVWNKAFYDNGKLYYSVSKNEELITDYTLKVYENGTSKEIFTLKEESINKIYNLNNTEIEVITSGGQDISTYFTKTYLVNKLTLGYIESNITYDNVAYVVEGADKHTEVNTEESNNSINKEDLIGSWRITGTSSIEYTPDYIYGSSIRQANSLEFKQDGTYSLAVGFAYAEEGNYEIQGDTIKLTNIKSKTDNPDVAARGTEAELKIKQVDGTLQVILEEKQNEYKDGKVVETLIIDVIFEKK